MADIRKDGFEKWYEEKRRASEKRKADKLVRKKLGEDSFLDEEMKDRGKLIRIISLIAVAVILLGIIGTISVVNITYEGKKPDAEEAEAVLPEEEPIEPLDKEDGREDDLTIAQLEEVREYLDYIGSSVDESTETLNTLYRDQESMKQNNQITKEFTNEVQKDITTLSSRFDTINKEIGTLRNDVTKLIGELKNTEKTSHDEDLKHFTDIVSRVDKLKDSYTASVSDITNLINKLESSGENRYKDLASALSDVKKGLSGENEKGFKSLQSLLDKIDSGLNKQLAEMNAGLNDRIDNMGNRVDSAFSSMNDRMDQNYRDLASSVESSLTTINNNMSVNNDEVLALLSQYGESLDAYADTVNRSFTSVANGKKQLRSALATKYNELGLGEVYGTDGETALADDGSFDDISSAIMRIRANDGTLHLPTNGTVVFVYHHHSKDRVGGGDSQDQNGGTYSDGYVSATSGGCFTGAVYHQHTGSKNSGGGCYGEKYTYYGTHVCGGTKVPDDTSSLGYRCIKCDAEYSYENLGGDCTARVKDDVPSTAYRLNCGKSESDVEGYRCTCGYHEGQMVSAYIEYVSY